MRFKIERNTLSDALVNASKASSSRSSIPALEGVLINLKNDIITVTGYDLEMGIKCKIKPAEAIEEGEVVVNAKIFGEMIRKMPSGLVEIYTENDVNVTLKSGTIVYNVIGVSGNNYPNIPELRNDITFYVDESMLKSMIRQTFHAISTNDMKPVHMGSKFHIKDNIMSVVSVDGARMAKRVEPVQYNDIDFVVPSKTLGELLRMLSDEPNEKQVAICIDRSQICFSKEDYMIISRILEGNFIDYEPSFRGTSSLFISRISHFLSNIASINSTIKPISSFKSSAVPNVISNPFELLNKLHNLPACRECRRG